MTWYIEALKKYAQFSGRSRRKEYWMFCLINLVISGALGYLGGSMSIMHTLSNVYGLAILIPSLAVGVRRMHDTDRSGWWYILPIVNFVFALMDGTRGDNRFGPDPKEG